MKFGIAIGVFIGLMGCGAVGSGPVDGLGGAGNTAGSVSPGTGGLASTTGGSAGTGSIGGTGSVMPAAGGMAGMTLATGGVPGTGGVATGGTAGQGTGGSQGTGGTKALTACSYPGASWTVDGMYRGLSNGGACRACATDQECVTAYGASNQCMGGSCALVGPWGPMPRQTCNSFSANFAIGQAMTTSAVSANTSDGSCVDQAKSFVGNRPSIYLCNGIPRNYSGTVLSVTSNSQNGWSDGDGNCNVTVVTQIPGSNGCQFEAIFSLLAQAPPKGDGPFPAPACN